MRGPNPSKEGNMTSAIRPLAVVTGASSGIGLEPAKELAARDHDLIIAAEDDELGFATSNSGYVAPLWRRVQADLADPGGVEKLVEHIGGRPVDVLAVNAGDGVNGEFAGDTLCEEQLRVDDLNVRSAVHLTKR